MPPGAYSGNVRVVVHYAEIGLKGRNRRRFEERLLGNIARVLHPLGKVKVRRLFGRLLVELARPVVFEEVAARLAHVFGIAYFARADVTAAEPEAIEREALAFAAQRSFRSFGVRVRRADKSHSFTSRELEGRIGARIAAQSGARVDLEHPELWVAIHVLSREAILLHERVSGPGGIPVGSSGRVVALISGGIDSPVAAHLAMKRGCRVAFVHFHSSPFTSEASQAKVRDLVRRLAAWHGPAGLFLVPLAEIQQTLVREAPAQPRIVLYRRFMLRLAEAIAARAGALALVTGESLGQVSSQTLGNLDTINRAATLPVLRPLISMDKAEIIEHARTIGTYAISIEPDEDCCSFLMPRQPATWTRPEEIETIERALDVKGMVAETLERIEREMIEPVG